MFPGQWQRGGLRHIFWENIIQPTTKGITWGHAHLIHPLQAVLWCLNGHLPQPHSPDLLGSSTDPSCGCEFQSLAGTCSPGPYSPAGSAASHTSLSLLANPSFLPSSVSNSLFKLPPRPCPPALCRAPKPLWSNAAPACRLSLSTLLCLGQLLSPPTALGRELRHTWFLQPSQPAAQMPLSAAALTSPCAPSCLPQTGAPGTTH